MRTAARTLALAACLPLLGGAASPRAGDRPAEGDVIASVTHLRSVEGRVLACLTAKPEAFPECDRDPAARKLTVAADNAGNLDFGEVPEGTYAIAIIHDENANGKLDKRLMIPREGFGFSKDAPVRMGPPSFGKAAFRVTGGEQRLTIRMRYML